MVRSAQFTETTVLIVLFSLVLGDVTYYFTLESVDAAGNTSPRSNIISVSMKYVDRPLEMWIIIVIACACVVVLVIVVIAIVIIRRRKQKGFGIKQPHVYEIAMSPRSGYYPAWKEKESVTSLPLEYTLTPWHQSTVASRSDDTHHYATPYADSNIHARTGDVGMTSTFKMEYSVTPYKKN
jgi:hypothetical protein